MAKKSVTSMKLRKLIVELRNEDKLSIGGISKTVGKPKSVIHSILRKHVETGSCGAKKPPGRPRKTTARQDRWIGDESKKDQFVTATAIYKRANANLSIRISRHTIYQILNEINLNSQVASMKPYISKKNKMSQLKFDAEHVIWTEEEWNCVHFSDESKFNPFGCDERKFVRHSPKEWYLPQCTKNCVKFGGGSVILFGMISAAGTRPLVRLHGKINATVYKEIWRNMYLIWELQLINQLYICKSMFHVKQRSLLRHFFLRRMLLLWSGLLKAQTWILLRMFGIY